MKKLLLLISLMISLTYYVQAQKHQENNLNLYHSCQEYFQSEHYDVCLTQTENLLAQSQGLSEGQVEHARFMQAASAFYLNQMNSSLLLRDFLADYSMSVYAPKAFFMLGTCAMNAGQYQDAIGFYNLCQRSALSKKEYEDYRFQLAYTHMQLEDFPKADSIFHELIAENGRYLLPATYYTAYIDYKEGFTQEAMKGFRQVADVEEYRHTAPFYIMQLQFNEGQFVEMLETAERLLQENPTQSEKTELYRLSAAAHYELKNYRDAQVFYEKYLAEDPEILRTDAYRIGMIHFLEKRYDKALTYFSKASGEDDALAQNAIFHVGVCYLQMQKNDMARLSFERASLSHHDKGTKEDALYNYALLCYETSFSPFNEQIKAFERILEEFPNSKYSDQIYSHLADAFLSNSNYQAAIDFIGKIDKPSQNMLQTKTKLYFLLGMERFNNADYQAAYKNFLASTDLGRKIGIATPEAYFWKGETAYRLNDLKTATRDFQTFLNDKNASKFKAYQIAHYDLAYCYFNSKNYNDALKYFEKYCQLASGKKEAPYVDALNRIGDCYYFARQYQQAEKYYAQTDRLTPSGNDYAVYQQAFCLGLRKQYKEKAELLQSFEKRFPKSDYLTKALYEEARAFVSMRQQKEAIAVFQRLMKKAPNSELARKAGVQIGLLHYQSGNATQAIAAYKKVIDDYPGSQEAQTAINDLKTIYVATNQVNEFVTYLSGLGDDFALQAGEQDSLSYMAAERLMMDSKNDQAIAAFQQYLQQFPQGGFYTPANYHCANLLYEKHRVDEAMEHYKNVLKQKGNPFMTDALIALSDHAYAKEAYNEGLAYYQQLYTLADNRNTRLQAKTGIMRCLAALEQSAELLAVCEELLQESHLSPELQREARHHKTQSLVKLNRSDEAVKDWESLSKDSQTAFGAEARFLLAEYWFEKGNNDKALKLAQDFLKDGTPHAYWMARCFVLMADIFMKQGDDFQAKQYLLSLKENYTDTDDIQDMISVRLQTIEERSNE